MVISLIADGIPDHGGMVFLGPFPPFWTQPVRLDVLLGVIPCPARIRHEHRQHEARGQGADQQSAQSLFAQQIP